MKNDELKTIAKRLQELENEVLIEFGLHRHSGGFVKIDMEEYDDEKIYVTIEDGIQSDCADRVNYEEQKLDRKTLEFIN